MPKITFKRKKGLAIKNDLDVKKNHYFRRTALDFNLFFSA